MENLLPRTKALNKKLLKRENSTKGLLTRKKFIGDVLGDREPIELSLVDL